MIGEQFDHGDEICGAVVSVRGKQEKIAIWTKNATNEIAQVILLTLLCHKILSFVILDYWMLKPYEKGTCGILIYMNVRIPLGCF